MIRRRGWSRRAGFAVTLNWMGGRWTPTILSIGRADRLVLNEGFFFEQGAQAEDRTSREAMMDPPRMLDTGLPGLAE